MFHVKQSTRNSIIKITVIGVHVKEYGTSFYIFIRKRVVCDLFLRVLYATTLAPGRIRRLSVSKTYRLTI